MPKVKISQLPAAATLTGTEIFPVVQGGVTSQTTLSEVITDLVPTPATTLVAPGLMIYNSLPSSYYSKTGTNTFQLSSYMEGGTTSTAWSGTPSTKAVFVPRAFGKSFTMSRWGIRTASTSTLTTTQVFRLIIYSDNAGVPGTILVDSGVFTPPSATSSTDVTAKYYWHNAAYTFAAQTQYWFCFGFTLVDSAWTPQVQNSSGASSYAIAKSQSAFATPTLTDIAYISLSATSAVTTPSVLGNSPPVTFLVSNSQSSNNTPVFYFQSA
jgi:hypothetical protein